MNESERPAIPAATHMDIELGPLADLELPASTELDLEGFDLVTALDLEGMAPRPRPAVSRPGPVASSGTQLVTIRIPARIVAALKARAAAKGTGYQTVANSVLRAAVREWEIAAAAIPLAQGIGK